MLQDDGALKYKLGPKIKFYFNNKLECSLSTKNSNKNNNNIEIGKTYISRILKF